MAKSVLFACVLLTVTAEEPEKVNPKCRSLVSEERKCGCFINNQQVNITTLNLECHVPDEGGLSADAGP